jgi:hypothetical protein
MAWLRRQIGGRLESRYRYSMGIVYNPFPWPAKLGQAVPVQREMERGALSVSEYSAPFDLPPKFAH